VSGFYTIVGLGNPGPKYEKTRHNAGFWFLDALLRESGLKLKKNSRLHCEIARGDIHGNDCLLIKPDTFMNRSGYALRAVMDYYKLDTDRLLVAYDELDLPAGLARLKQDGGHGGHNGMRDIFAHIGSREFLRLRIGIGHPGQSHLVTNYVLNAAGVDDQAAIDSAIERAVQQLPRILAGDVAAAMNELHSEI
jgi:PTH1 family peptidyl-tRNA hydrolase